MIVDDVVAIRTTERLLIVAADAGVMLDSPFTVEPEGTGEWEPITAQIEMAAGSWASVADAHALRETAFLGGLLALRNGSDPEPILWVTIARPWPGTTPAAALSVIGGHVVERQHGGRYRRLQPAGGSAAMAAPLRDPFWEGVGISLSLPDGFRASGWDRSERHRRREKWSLLVTESGSVHAIVGGRWSKVTARPESEFQVGWGDWRAVEVRSIPSHVDGGLRELLDHPDTAVGLANARVGNRIYLGSSGPWVVTTPLAQRYDGRGMEGVREGWPAIAVSRDRAWLVEGEVMLPLHAGEPRSRPRFVAVGDAVDGSRIDHIVELDR